MGRPKQQFSLYKRDNGIWYYMTYDAFGKRTTKKSTGQTNKTAAQNYCLNLFKDNLLIPDSSIRLKAYFEMKNFYVWGKCIYCIENELTQSYATQSLKRFQNHILPLLGNMTFDDITPNTINQWQTKLLTEKQLSPKTVRDTRSVLFIVLDSAKVDGFLTKDLKTGLKRLPKNKKKIRGILTESEVRKLFDKANYEEYWGGNYLYYTASLVACFTGMRQGEILALTPEKIFENHIYVNQSYGTYGLGPTKTKETRQVYMNSIVKQQLIEIMPESGFIFTLSKTKPLTPQRLTEGFYRAIKKMGITKDLKDQRNITFHSFRHFLVTYLRGKGVTDAEITSITGQRTIKIIDDYTRFDKLRNHNVVAALESI